MATQLIGTAGELPKAPTQQTKFLEDMDESELAQAVRLFSPSSTRTNALASFYSSVYLLAFRT